MAAVVTRNDGTETLIEGRVEAAIKDGGLEVRCFGDLVAAFAPGRWREYRSVRDESSDTSEAADR